MSYWAIDCDSLDGTMREVKGPFDTRKSAEAFIRSDFEACWNLSEIPLADRDDEYSGTWLLLEQVAHVRPVGLASVKVKLVEEQK